MIAPIDQNDFGIASLQGPRRRDPGKAAADDDDALPLRRRWIRRDNVSVGVSSKLRSFGSPCHGGGEWRGGAAPPP